ncbi:TPA: glycosyltransferase [Proteus mirabilis]|uniref:Gt1 n=6 Tax=Proteus mirabilis TaxID=584 RepID=A0A385JMR2_PROMI|nr:glycosyltransferase [Proteus mirabilis]ASB02007.1 hypothetical protein AM403_10195 [Proteus mirabilis]AXY99613.1 gt1 [Proteus mirabilis]EKV9647099.1 glycosyltransferase [Proteus mirabilis]ELA8985686.1 glycosyltransferase [Proteus mirabilis]MBF0801142.1 glycosyltransferase [Proteus mirabilis]
MIYFLLQNANTIGGVENTTKNIVNILNERGKKNINILSIFGKHEEKEERITYLFTSKKFRYIKYFLSFLYMKRNKASIVITNYFIFNVLNIIFSHIFNYKCIIQEHSSFYHDSAYKKVLKKLFYKYADKFLVLNDYDKKLYNSLSLYPIVMKNSIGEMNINKQLDENNNIEQDEYFLIASRIDENKRVELAIKSFIIYKLLGGKRKLLICGDGDLSLSLKQRYSKIKDILFLGMKKNIYIYIKKASCLLITSKLECLPTSIIEAKYLSTPTIAFSVPSGIPEMITNNVDGFLIKDNSIYEYAEKMLSLDNPSILYSMKKNATLSYSKYSEKLSYDFYLNLLTSLEERNI